MLLVVVVSAVPASVMSGGALSADYNCAEIVRSINELNALAISAMNASARTNGSAHPRADFDPTLYFSHLRHIAPPEGYALDYISHLYEDSRACVYLRRTNDSHMTIESYYDGVPRSNRVIDVSFRPAQRLVLDGTPESYCEQVLFNWLVGCFNADPWFFGQVLTTPSDVDRIAAEMDRSGLGDLLPPDQRALLKTADFRPTVTFVDSSSALVSVVVFHKTSGISRESVQIAREYPHTWRMLKSEVVAKCEWKVMY
jgi:hypothetical protein